MKRILNIILYIIIFFLVVTIEILSIKKFFDLKDSESFKNINSYNSVATFVSFNEIVGKSTVDSIEEKEEVVYEQNDSVIQIEDEEVVIEENTLEESEDEIEEESEYIEKPEEIINEVLYDNLSEEQLLLKLEKNLKNELIGTSVNFVDYYKKTGLDPYLSVAIVLHETGCIWNCSKLVRECYNFGGMKGGDNKYKDTNYSCYSSKEEGINAYLDMLYNNYYSKGLTTPELINPKYAASLEWSVKINNYINKIKNS